MDPATMFLIGSAVSKGLGALGGALTNKSNQKAADKRSAADRLHEKDLATQRLAGDESMANPFRHVNDQVGAAFTFDQIANTKPKTISLPGLNPKYMPTLGGGYQPSATMTGAATAARDAVLGGQGTAPTMTNPGNYGTTGALDLMTVLRALGFLPPAAASPTAAPAGAKLPPPTTIGAGAMNRTMPVPLDDYSYAGLR